MTLTQFQEQPDTHALRARPEDNNKLAKREERGLVSDIDEMSENIERIHRVQLVQIPQGYIEPVDVDLIGSKLLKLGCYPKWFSLSAYNDGPDTVYLGVNRKEKFRTIRINESVDIDFGAPVIEFLYYHTTSGGTATLRILGKH